MELDGGLVSKHQVHVEAAQQTQCDEYAEGNDPRQGDALPVDESEATSPRVPDRFYEGLQEDHHNKPATTHQVQQEQAKVPVVVVAHAIVDPWAMVVHLEHAPIADAAMVCA